MSREVEREQSEGITEEKYTSSNALSKQTQRNTTQRKTQNKFLCPALRSSHFPLPVSICAILTLSHPKYLCGRVTIAQCTRIRMKMELKSISIKYIAY